MANSGSTSNNPTPPLPEARNQRSDSWTSRLALRYNDGRQSLEQDSLNEETSSGRFRSDSTGRVVDGSGCWEGKDLSRRGNIHRSHLSSSIHNGMTLIAFE